MSEVQRLVDALAGALDRPVGVDDRRYDAVAYSAHGDGGDGVRRRSILGRRTPAEVIRWLDVLQLERAHEPVRLPANAELGMLPRVCCPVRFGDRLLGFLWLMEHGSPVSAGDIAAGERTAESVAQELYRLERDEQGDRRREQLLVASLVRPHATGEQTPTAPAALDGGWCGALLLSALTPGAPPAPFVDVRLLDAVERVRRRRRPGELLVGHEGSTVTVVHAGPSSAGVDALADEVATAVRAQLSGIPGLRVIAGTGEPAADRERLPAVHAQSRTALRLAVLIAGAPVPVRWRDLRGWRAALELLDGRDAGRHLPEEVQRLLDQPDGLLLVRSLETYLDRAGNVASAAADLFVHRSNLYRRLRRIEHVAGVDLDRGPDRLELHLGVRLWRLGDAPGAEGAWPT